MNAGMERPELEASGELTIFVSQELGLDETVARVFHYVSSFSLKPRSEIVPQVAQNPLPRVPGFLGHPVAVENGQETDRISPRARS